MRWHRVTIFPPLNASPHTAYSLEDVFYVWCASFKIIMVKSSSEMSSRSEKMFAVKLEQQEKHFHLPNSHPTLRWNFYEQQSIMKSQHLSLKRLCFPMFSLRLGVIAHRFFPRSHIPHTGLDIWAEIKGQNCLEQKKERSEKILNLKGIKVSISFLSRLNVSNFTSFTFFNTHFAIKGFAFAWTVNIICCRLILNKICLPPRKWKLSFLLAEKRRVKLWNCENFR